MAVSDPKLGKNMRVQVGTIKGKQLRFLGQVQNCRGEDCPLKEVCDFKPKGHCTVIYTFLSSLYKDWVDPVNGIGDRLSQIQLDKIGVHLIPLYHILIRLLLETYVIEEMTYENKQGSKAMHPQFQEIPKIINQIRLELKDIGLEALWKEKFGDEKPTPVGKKVKDLLLEGQGYEVAQGQRNGD